MAAPYTSPLNALTVDDMPLPISRHTFGGSSSPLPRVALLALLVALAGCGNKGPLYLPSSPEPREAASAEPAPAVELSATPDNQ